MRIAPPVVMPAEEVLSVSLASRLALSAEATKELLIWNIYNMAFNTPLLDDLGKPIIRAPQKYRKLYAKPKP